MKEYDNLHVVDHPLINHKIRLIRDKNTDHQLFRVLVNEVGVLVAFELTRNFDSFNVDVETPLAKTTGIKVDGNNVVIVPILRAGLGMVDGLIKLIPNARIGYVGMERDEQSHQPIDYYVKVPMQSTENKNFIIVDPMLATGGTAIATAKKLKQLGAKHIKFMCLIAAPEGVQNFCKSYPDIQVYTAVLDEKLNDDKYIVPGLGDAGDRLFGTE